MFKITFLPRIDIIFFSSGANFSICGANLLVPTFHHNFFKILRKIISFTKLQYL